MAKVGLPMYCRLQRMLAKPRKRVQKIATCEKTNLLRPPRRVTDATVGMIGNGTIAEARDFMAAVARCMSGCGKAGEAEIENHHGTDLWARTL